MSQQTRRGNGWAQAGVPCRSVSETSDTSPSVLRTEGCVRILCTQERDVSSRDVPPGGCSREMGLTGLCGETGKPRASVSDLADESQSSRLGRQPAEGGIINISTGEMERTLPVTGGSSSRTGSGPDCRWGWACSHSYGSSGITESLAVLGHRTAHSFWSEPETPHGQKITSQHLLTGP